MNPPQAQPARPLTDHPHPDPRHRNHAKPARPVLVARLGGLQSSHRWTELPGGWDRINARALFASTNPWGIPDLPPTTWAPQRLIAYTAPRTDLTAAAAAGDTAVHFFLDDYRFEIVWTKPQRGLTRIAAIGAALAPDFSVWTDLPPAVQVWQTYRSRWCAAWLAHHGITVIPTLTWAGPDTWPFAFTGLTRGGTVAVSTVGIHRDPQAREIFTAGWDHMLHRLAPDTILVHGRPLTPTPQTGPPCTVGGEPDEGPVVRYYPDHWQTRTRNHRPARHDHSSDNGRAGVNP